MCAYPVDYEGEARRNSKAQTRVDAKQLLNTVASEKGGGLLHLKKRRALFCEVQSTFVSLCVCVYPLEPTRLLMGG